MVKKKTGVTERRGCGLAPAQDGRHQRKNAGVWAPTPSLPFPPSPPSPSYSPSPPPHLHPHKELCSVCVEQHGRNEGNLVSLVNCSPVHF